MVCKTFKKQANSTWCLLRQARKVMHQLKETTITDLLILNLKKDLTNEILIKDFSPHEESRTGADWEWWFRGRYGNWLGFRVQAKIINISSNEFKELHYQNKNGIQCDHLINNSVNYSPTLIPIYCLYANFKPKDINGVWNSFAINERVTDFGIAVVSAYRIQFLRNRPMHPQKHLKDIAPFMFPWHFLVCPSLLNPVDLKCDLAERVFHHWKETLLLSDSNIISEKSQKINSVQTVKSPPPYVENIFRKESTEEMPDNIYRVTIFAEPMLG